MFSVFEIIGSDLAFLNKSLLRREYLSLAVNMFTNILKTFHIIKRDSYQRNCLHSDQYLW